MKLLSILAALALAGCLRDGAFRCDGDADCVRGALDGTCEPVGYCSFVDPACATGRRYADLSGPFSNECVTGGDASFAVGGTLSGLTGSGLVLQNNGVDDLPRSANGPFTFSMPVRSGNTYAITVKAPPTGQSCAVAKGNGIIVDGPISDAVVTCFVAGAGQGVRCAPSTTCPIGTDYCCADKDTGVGVCKPAADTASCSFKRIYCDDAADCGGGICCAQYSSNGDFHRAECVAGTSACVAGMGRVEYWCDPAAPAACPSGMACTGAAIGSFKFCQ